jgi:hypothetical protein
MMAFDSEEEAFAAYAKIYPQHPVFLICPVKNKTPLHFSGSTRKLPK